MRNALKILIVDDDKANSQMMSEVVKRMGFKPIVANKVSDALNVVRLQTVHAAIVDVLLPKMTGVELVQEFRKTRFAENPVIFVSGVFKDKAFAAEAIKKTAALSFLFKPFDVEELKQVLTGAMENLISAETWTVQSLLTRKLNSDRERAKAIEHLQEIKGRDLPFVLSILMEVASSGHLNIVNDAGEIFGVSLAQGTIAEVDSLESQSSAVLSMISKGFLSQEDWDAFQSRGVKKFTLESLVAEGIVSPHAVSEARREQIINDFRTICSAQILQVNFVPQEENEDPPKHAVKLQNLMELFTAELDEFFPESYLEDFYSPVMNSPVRLVHLSATVIKVWETDQFREIKHLLKSIVEKNGSIEQAISDMPELKSKIMQCLHYLVLIRAVMFDDLNRAKNINSMVERYKKLYTQLDGKTPDKVFEYFGAAITASTSAFQSIFDEYAKSNNPEMLGKDATPELRELSRKCYTIVEEAKNVMVDSNAREALMQKLKDDASEMQQKASTLTSEALEMIRKNQFKEAVAKLKDAEKLHTTNRWLMILIWAEVKAGASKGHMAEMFRRLEAIMAEERRNPFFFMAAGLLKKGLGDPTATAMFEKALQLDSDFAEARRELNQSNKKAEKLDIFNADITQVVSQLFRRKAD